MSYDLEFYFEPEVRRSRILEYFTARKRFKVEDDKVVYAHSDTGVYFFMRLRSGRNILLQWTASPLNSRSITAGPAISALRPRKRWPHLWRRFSRGSKILKCAAWAMGHIHVTAFSMVGISAMCLPSTAPYLATPIGASLTHERWACLIPFSTHDQPTRQPIGVSRSPDVCCRRLFAIDYYQLHRFAPSIPSCPLVS